VPEIPSPGAGADGELVWSWNRTDVSQFVASTPQLALGTGGTPGTSAVSVAAVSERGNVLRFASDGVSTDMTALWLVSDAISFSGIRRDLLVEIEVYDGTPSAVSMVNRYFGPALLCDDDADHGFVPAVVGSSGNQKSAIIENGARLAVSGATGFAPLDASFHRFHIRADKPVADVPRMSIWREYWWLSKGGYSSNRTGSTAGVRGNVNDLGSDSTLGATWDAETLDRFGFGVFSDNGATGPVAVELLDVRVFLVPE